MSEETLISDSNIWLFGRELDDISFDPSKHKKPKAGNKGLLLEQASDKDAKLVRIYSFIYEGCLYNLTRPAIFLVHGAGTDLENVPFMLEDGQNGGVAAKDVKAWSYDRADFTLRLDVESGSFDALLLAAELVENPAGRASGSVVRSSGSVVQASGSVVQASGSVVRSAGSVVRASGSVVRPKKNDSGDR